MPELDLTTAIFATQARVIVREVPESLGELARKRALDPSIFDQFPPFIWASEISSDRLDSYYTEMDPDTTLKNYAADAEIGVSVLVGHNRWDMPIGQSLTGQFEVIAGVTRVTSDAYVLSDPETATVLNRLKAGIARDISVGFSPVGAKCLCSICGADMWRDWDCWHVPGFEYEITEEGSTGTKGKKRMVLCKGRIVDAHLSEYSLVYDGATPGAAVLQAQRCAEAGRLSAREIGLIEGRYRMRLPDKRLLLPGAAPVMEDRSMDPKKETVDTEPAPAAIEVRATESRTGEELDAVLLPMVRQAGAAEGLNLRQAVEWLIAEHARLVPLADEGREYRQILTDEVCSEGVRALGEKFNEETQRKVYATLPLATLRTMRDTYTEIGNARFPGGRKSKDLEEPKEPVTPQRKTPAAAFRG